MGTAIKHPMPDQVKSSFVIFDIRALWLAHSARMSTHSNSGRQSVKGTLRRYIVES